MRPKGLKLPLSLRDEASSTMGVCIRKNSSHELLMDKETNEKQNKTKEAQMTTGQANLCTQQILTECL